MKITISDRVAALPVYALAQVPTIKRRLLAAGMDVIDLGAGDADGPPPTATIDALHEALGITALHKYGFQQGLPAFREAAVRWVARRFGQTFDANSEMLPLIGSKEGLSHLAFAVCNPGDVVIIPEPGYQAYVGGAILSGAERCVVPLRPENQFLVELEQLSEATLRRAKLVYINYPNNPTAAIAPRDYLERLVAACRKYGIVLAYDNAYCDTTFDGYIAPSIFEIPGARDVAVEFFSMSKSFQMTGWRLGFAIGGPELIGALTKVKSYTDTGPFLALQQAAAYTLDHAEALTRPIVEELTRRRDAAVSALTEAGFAVETPVAAMYLWVPLPTGLASAVFTNRALEEEGVVLMPGSAFGPGGEGFFRIALTVPPARLREAVARLGRTLAACSGLVAAMRADREFRLPGRSRVPWWIWVLALVVHISLALVVIGRRHANAPSFFDAHDIVMSDSVRAVLMPYARRGRQPATVAAPPAARMSVGGSPRLAPDVEPPVGLAAVPPTTVDTQSTGTTRILQPRYGDGRLWVHPMAASPREIARTLTGKTDAQLTDSAVTSMVQAYLDAMAKEQAASPNSLPSWTTKIGGKTVGLDSKWIYLGPLKIPTMLLALLPIHVQGNPTQAEFNAKLQVMRADLLEAARRAETYDDFKKAVKDLHEQTERAREFKKNQRTPPDTGHHG